MTMTWIVGSAGARSGTPLTLKPYVQCAIQLPDLFVAGNMGLQGIIAGVSGGAVMLAQGLTLPTPAYPQVPATGSTFLSLQADPYTGICTIYTSTTADPAPQPNAGTNSGTNQVVLARQTIPSTAGTVPYFTPFVPVTFN